MKETGEQYPLKTKVKCTWYCFSNLELRRLSPALEDSFSMSVTLIIPAVSKFTATTRGCSLTEGSGRLHKFLSVKTEQKKSFSGLGLSILESGREESSTKEGGWEGRGLRMLQKF